MRIRYPDNMLSKESNPYIEKKRIYILSVYRGFTCTLLFVEIPRKTLCPRRRRTLSTLSMSHSLSVRTPR
nr:MAG TPA: hypothetical protein [Caudoviricetes sp.]